jgi:hypothetical protein
MTTIPTPKPTEFSLTIGGPLFQLYRRMHLSGDELELLYRRLLVIPLFAWLPLLFLAVFDGHAIGGGIKIDFLHDIETHVRFLIALPVLLIGEVVVHQRLGSSVRHFLDRRIIVPEDVPRFDAAVDSAVRARNSVAAEAVLLVLVYTLGLWTWRSQIALGDSTWYAMPDAKHLNLTSAGYWFVFVSIPLFQFILLRWYLRLVIWFRLLWQISRLNLRLSAVHPDRAGGIGFLAKTSYTFSPILFAQGAILSGMIGSRVLYEGQALLSFKVEAAGFVCFFLFVILGPLVMFTPSLSRAKRNGSAEYGLLASRFVFGFEDKWLLAGQPEENGLLRTRDIRTLADLGISYSAVRQMRLVPFGPEDITRLAAAVAAPLLPLALTIFSIPQLLSFLIKVAFR